MYCSYCGFNLQHETSFCSSCGKNIEFLFNVKQPSTSEGGTGNFRSLKKKERQSCFKKKKETPRDNPVKISVGLMQQKDGVLKAVRGMVLPLVVKPGLDAEHLLEAAEQKMKDVNKNLRGGPYLLLYPDGTKVTCIPRTETPFSLKLYKEAVGKAYQRITLYICTADDYYNKSQLSDSDSSDSEVITSRSTAEVNSADTVLFEPNPNSTTNDVGGSSPDDLAAPYTGTSRNLMDTTCYSKCTQPYVPIVIKEEEDLGSDANSDAISKDTDSITAGVMEEIKTEPVDFVKEFQEYLTQQTQHVNMISGSVCGEKEAGEPFQAVAPRSEQNGVDAPSVEVSLPMEDGSDVHMDGLERTCDGKYKCSYCSYANKGMARLIEHTRIHTGEKPHRCQLCPFASAYERHLEAHMRSHTGEKPYKCDLCAFRCSDRSNLSHHRRRRHKLLPTRAVRSPFSNKRMLSSLQKRTGSLGFSRRLLISNPASMGLPKSDYLQDLSHNIHQHTNGSEYKNHPKVEENDCHKRVANGLNFNNPLDQLSTLAGQLADLHPESPASPDRQSLKDEKPILIQQVSTCSNRVQVSPKNGSSPSVHGSCSPVFGLVFENAPTASVGNSQPGTPTPASTAPDPQLLNKCQHCDIHFLDIILYTIHMGCHGYEHPFQCNICGHMCVDKYDFSCHFARGQHKK